MQLRHPIHRQARRQGQQGFTLLEILVAVLIMAIGVLGVIMLEGLALKNNHSAYQRTQATLLSYDLMDRIRANRAMVDDYDATPISTASNSFVKADLAEWEARLLKVLPTASHARSISDDKFTVSISWSDNREQDGNPDTTFTNTFRP